MAEGKKNVPQGGANLIATAENDITIAFYNDILPQQDPTIDAKAPHLGLALYDDVLRDGRCSSAFDKRRSKLKRREWRVDAGNEDGMSQKAAELCREVLQTLNFDNLSGSLQEAIVKGFAIVELIWGRNKSGAIVPTGFKAHDQRRFVFDKKWKPRLLTREAMMKGIELPDRKFIVHRFGAKANNPYGLGLGATLYWHVLFKREGVAFWMVFLEKFASPTPVGKYPDGTPEAEQDKLLRALRGMVSAGALAVPLGTEVSFLEASRSGSVSYEEWCRYWDEQSSEVINGETLSTNIRGAGSRAAAETHSEEGDGIVDTDCDDLSETLNATLMQWITDLNYPGATAPKVWRVRPKNAKAEEEQRAKREERLQKQLKTLKELKSMGYRVKNEKTYLEDAFETPLIEALPEDQKQQVEPEEDKAFSENDEPVAHLLEELLAAGDPAFAEYLEKLEEAFRDASDYADLSNRLLTFAEGRDHEAFAEVLGNAMALAELEGHAGALDETNVYASYKPKKKVLTREQTAFAEPVSPRLEGPDAEALAFFRAKLRMPTATSTDIIRSAHDRAFVVAGVRDDDLLADLQNAVDDGLSKGVPFHGWTDRDGIYHEGFRDRFRQIVKEHGWDHSMSEGRRARVIYETNLSAARSAGRVKHLTDTKVMKAFPYWEYLHGATRHPLHPREQHQQWNGLILRADDPFWRTHTPKNGYFCSCDFRPISKGKLKRLRPKNPVPDPTPEILMKPVVDPRTGQLVEMPAGIGFGFDYQPGRDYSRVFTPPPIPAAPDIGRQLNLPSPRPEDLPPGKPFKQPLVEHAGAKDNEDLTARFLAQFGQAINGAVVFRDKSGTALMITDSLFKKGSGHWKLDDRRRTDMLRLAETIIEPDEIWANWQYNPVAKAWYLSRYYLRSNEDGTFLSNVRWAKDGWWGSTVFRAVTKGGNPKPDYIENHRKGRLLYRREE